MTFLVTFGGWARPCVMFHRGIVLRVVLGFVALWWINQDFEMWLETMEKKGVPND